MITKNVLCFLLMFPIDHSVPSVRKLGHAQLIPWMADFSGAFLVQSVSRKKNYLE